MRRYLSLSRSPRRTSKLPDVAEDLPNTAEKQSVAGEINSDLEPQESQANRSRPASLFDAADGSVAEETEVPPSAVGSTAALMSPNRDALTLPSPNLKIKKVDYYWSSWSKTWKYKNTGSKVTPDSVGFGSMLTSPSTASNDPWQGFCFVVVRKLPGADEVPSVEPTFQVVVKSPYLVSACKRVMGYIPGISWSADPLEVRFLILLDLYGAC